MTKKTPDLFESEQQEAQQTVDAQSEPGLEQQEPSVTFTAGQTLANARTAAGLALEDLAEELRVPLKVLDAIERDEWPENLPETFIRGYIRAYAKKVNVPEADVLPAVDSTAASIPSSTEMHSFSRRSKRKKIERRLILVTWALGIALIFAFGIFFLQSYSDNQVAPVADTKSSDSLNVISSSTTTSEVSIPAFSDSSNVEGNNDSGDQAGDSLNDSVENNDNANNASGETFAEKAPLTVSQSTKTQVSEGPVTSTTNPEQRSMQLTDEQMKLVAQGSDGDDENYMVVEFKFENDCWVEVYDAYNERIAIGNKPAGYLMTLNAQGPFNVLLGNPAGVSIWVNGQPYDLSDMPTNRVARFEIEEQP